MHHCGIQATWAYVTGLVVFRVVAGQVVSTQPATQPAVSSPVARVLHFPADRSLGTLSVQDAGLRREIETFFHHIDGLSDQWEWLGEARGDVAIPAGKRVCLWVGREGSKDLSPLAGLAPDDLYQLSVSGSELSADERETWGLPRDIRNAGDAVMPHVARLTGLRILDLRGTDVTAAGLGHIETMKSLECLDLPRWVNDAGIAHVAKLAGLKRLYFHHNRVSDKGLAILSQLTELEELELVCEQISERGLVHLKRLPKLQYLSFSGRFSDASMAFVSQIPSLKILTPTDAGDEGLAHLVAAPHLERLHLSGQRRVTNAGMVHVARMPSLRQLDISDTKVSDAGVEHLRGLRNLELLHLPGDLGTDALVDLLASLPQLHDLAYRGSSNSGHGDKALEQVGKMAGLERLFVCGRQVTDAGMASIGRCRNLKSLTLFFCPITNEGLGEIGRLKSLRRLEIFGAHLTTSGITQLNGLDRLVRLQVGNVRPDEAHLEISGLTNLRWLSLEIGVGGEPLRDADFACLARLKRLERLGLETYGHDGGIGDAGLAHLSGLTKLQVLGVGGRVTDAGLAQLANMKQLNTLIISGDLTAKGLLKLEQHPALGRLEVMTPRRLSDDAVDRVIERLPRLGMFKYGPDSRHMEERTLAGRM